MLSSYQSLENRIHYAKELQLDEAGRKPIGYDRYIDALFLLNAEHNDSLEEIESKFLKMQKETSKELYDARNNGEQVKSDMLRDRMNHLYQAYKDIRKRKLFKYD